jgi:hypothetical protein
MAAISYAISHGTSTRDAAERTASLLKDLVQQKPHLFSTVDWGQGGLQANMKGKGFQASFTVTETDVSVNIKLGLLARPFKGKVEASVRERLESEFS